MSRMAAGIVLGLMVGVALVASGQSESANPGRNDTLEALRERMRPPEAQDSGSAGASDTAPGASSKEQAGESQPQSTPTLDDLRRQMEANPMIEPSRSPTLEQRSGPAINVGVDSRVLGVAPGGEEPELRREGEFVIQRRGRIATAPNGNYTLFVFESDGEQMDDPPMILVPCRTLEDMEELVQQHGDRIVFILSGQILTYRGANYLLPTMMKLDYDRGNIRD